MRSSPRGHGIAHCDCTGEKCPSCRTPKNNPQSPIKRQRLAQTCRVNVAKISRRRIFLAASVIAWQNYINWSHVDEDVLNNGAKIGRKTVVYNVTMATVTGKSDPKSTGRKSTPNQASFLADFPVRVHSHLKYPLKSTIIICSIKSAIDPQQNHETWHTVSSRGASDLRPEVLSREQDREGEYCILFYF